MKNLKIYSLDISAATEDEFTLWYSQMSEEKKLAADRLQNKEKRLSKIAADALCRKAVSENCGIPCNEIIFGTAEKGNEGVSVTDREPGRKRAIARE